ncbi:restriction endonuclease subunit S [Serratia fonticola]
MVSNRWDVRPLADIALITSGGTPSRAKPEFWQNGTIPWIRTTEVQNCILTHDDIQEYISEEGLKGSSAKLVPSGTVLLAMIGQGKTRGQVALLKFESTINQNCAAIIFNNDQEPYFHFNFLLSQYEAIRSMSNSAGQSNLNGALVKTIKVPVPPLAEQKKIAKILSAWDKAIEITEKFLLNSQQQKKSLMQKLLTGKKRLLDKNGRRFNSEWKSCRLGDIGEIKSAGVDKKIVEGEAPVRLLNFTDVFKKTFIFADEINHWVTAPYSKVDGCSVLKGDVFFTPSSETRDEVGMSAVVAADIDSCCYSYHIVRFRIKENWDLNFKAFAFSTPTFRKQVSLLADGSGQRYVVSQDGFRSVMISYPPIEEQREIGKVLRLAEEETIILDKKLNHLKQEKKALMQQLLTGKRRVKTEVA